MPGHGVEEEDEDKPCRACSDFKSWAKSQSKTTTSEKLKTPSSAAKSPVKPEKECPLDKGELGTATWSFLHTMAAYYPEKPSRQESNQMSRFFNIFAQFYPCEPCALDFQEDIKNNPPKTASRDELAKWLCERHNTVNIKLDKPVFDCSKVRERWRDGWLDGSCD